MIVSCTGNGEEGCVTRTDKGSNYLKLELTYLGADSPASGIAKFGHPPELVATCLLLSG